MQASRPPYEYMACQELLMDMPFAQAELYLSKLTTSHFSTLNMDFANWNMLKRILIAMFLENKADCNKKLQDMCRGIHNTSVQAVGIIRPVGTELPKIKFSSGPFWTHKIKTKAKYISISNVLHLLSAPASIPRVGAI